MSKELIDDGHICMSQFFGQYDLPDHFIGCHADMPNYLKKFDINRGAVNFTFSNIWLYKVGGIWHGLAINQNQDSHVSGFESGGFI